MSGDWFLIFLHPSTSKPFVLTGDAKESLVSRLSPWHTHSTSLLWTMPPFVYCNLLCCCDRLPLWQCWNKASYFYHFGDKIASLIRAQILSMCQHSWSSSVTQLNIFLRDYSEVQIQAQHWTDGCSSLFASEILPPTCWGEFITSHWKVLITMIQWKQIYSFIHSW